MQGLTPITHAMLLGEASEGRQPIYPEAAPAWFQPEDWRGWPVLSVADGELHIIAIWSNAKGALTRLIAGAREAGLSPVIVEPMGAMHDILAKWGWTKRVVGDGWHAREEWRPSALLAARTPTSADTARGER